MLQQTLLRPISYTGVGLHSGKEVELKLLPTTVNNGISFHIHTGKSIQIIKPRPNAVITTALATTLGNNKVKVSTVEHLMAAFVGLQVDNVECHIYGEEIPIMDGSALPITNLIRKTGLRSQYALRKVARITRPINFIDGEKIILARPHDGFYVDYTINFPHKLIGVQRYKIEIEPETFNEIAYARTFGFAKEVEYLRANNLALGGSLKNAIVLDDENVINKEGLRTPDEFVRHKILDFVGDLANFGLPIQGAFEVHCSGHNFNNLFVRHLEENQDSLLEIKELIPSREKIASPLFELNHIHA